MSSKNPTQSQELKKASYELLILLLSLLSIFNLLVFVTPRINPVVEGVVGIVDGFITIIFMLDFLYRFFTAESKTDYFFGNWGWADLLASMPVRQLKIFRIFRIVRVIRLLREYGWHQMLDEVRNHRAGSALYLIVFVVILVLEFGGMGIVFAEASDVNSNIKTAGDGVWWAFVTITTVGYGDRYPVTTLGRLMGVAVMILGVGTFGVLAGFLASAFTSGDEDSSEQSAATDQGDEMGEFRRLLHEQEIANARLMKKLDRIELTVNSLSSDSSLIN